MVTRIGFPRRSSRITTRPDLTVDTVPAGNLAGKVGHRPPVRFGDVSLMWIVSEWTTCLLEQSSEGPIGDWRTDGHWLAKALELDYDAH